MDEHVKEQAERIAEIGALRAAIPYMDAEQIRCGEAELYEDAEEARRAHNWALGRIGELRLEAERKGTPID